MTLTSVFTLYQKLIATLEHFNGLGALAIRLYLAPVMIQAGWNKYSNFSDILEWFRNTEWGLGLPFPEVLAFLATATELLGGIFLLLGLFTRLVSIPLMVTMLVAAISVHWENGWLAISDSSSWLANGTIYYDESIMQAPDKLAAANAILQQHGHYDWLTESGKFVILNNGIEFAATYFILLLALLFIGGGRYLSLDYWLTVAIEKRSNRV